MYHDDDDFDDFLRTAFPGVKRGRAKGCDWRVTFHLTRGAGRRATCWQRSGRTARELVATHLLTYQRDIGKATITSPNGRATTYVRCRGLVMTASQAKALGGARQSRALIEYVVWRGRRLDSAAPSSGSERVYARVHSRRGCDKVAFWAKLTFPNRPVSVAPMADCDPWTQQAARRLPWIAV